MTAAVEFSFLLGVVTLLAATGYEAYKEGRIMLEAYSFPSLTLGFCTAGLAAAATVVWMVHYLRRHGLAVFGYYRVALAAVVAALLAGGLLAP
jgi:undecaprenyl-diphosphatase